MRWNLVIAVLACAHAALAQDCQPDWLRWPVQLGPNAAVRCLQPWDPDLTGPEPPVLLVAGDFYKLGSLPAGRVATWTGSQFFLLGSVSATVYAAAIFDPDGVGPAVASPVIGGSFKSADGRPASHIAQWDGRQWQPLGLGVDSDVTCMLDRGDQLLVGGWFTTAGGQLSPGLASWNGKEWTPFPQKPGGLPYALVSWNGQLYAGGYFTLYGGPDRGVLRWTGSAWEVLSDGPTDVVFSLCVHEGNLYAGGYFSECGNGEFTRGVAVFDGKTWKPVGLGLGPEAIPYALTTFDPDGAGTAPAVLVAAGTDTDDGSPTGLLTVWDDTSWQAVTPGINHRAEALAVFDGAVAVGGELTQAGGVPSPFFALWGCPQVCYADCDSSGELDIDDFICFQTFFGLGEADADCDRSGELGIDDFLCFQAAFGAGCK